MKLLILIFIVGVFVFYGCSKSVPHIEKAYELINSFSKETKKYGLIPFGIGGMFHDGINEFNLDYLYYTDEMTIEESRKLLVYNLELFFLKINNDIEIKEYLTNYPYDENYTYFTISFFNNGSLFLLPPNIAKVSCFNGRIVFAEYCNEFVKIFSETYAESYEKVYGVPLPENRFNVPYDQHRNKQSTDE